MNRVRTGCREQREYISCYHKNHGKTSLGFQFLARDLKSWKCSPVRSFFVSALLSVDDWKKTQSQKSITVLKSNKRQVTQTIVLNISFPLGNEKILIGMNIRCWPELSKSNLVWGMPVACMLKYVKKKKNNSKQTISYHCCCTPPPPLSYFCHSIWYAYPNVNIRCWPELSEGNLVWGVLIACMLKWVKKKTTTTTKK